MIRLRAVLLQFSKHKSSLLCAMSSLTDLIMQQPTSTYLESMGLIEDGRIVVGYLIGLGDASAETMTVGICRSMTSTYILLCISSSGCC